MWKNIPEPINNTVGRMHFVCWITKATDTFRIWNSYCFSTATVVTQTLPVVSFIRTLPYYLLITKNAVHVCTERGLKLINKLTVRKFINILHNEFKNLTQICTGWTIEETCLGSRRGRGIFLHPRASISEMRPNQLPVQWERSAISAEDEVARCVNLNISIKDEVNL
jgi:hypothetical protein